MFNMTKCEGPPNMPCPHNASGRSVRHCQGDMFLCTDCENFRFPPVRNAAGSPADRSKKDTQKKPGKPADTVNKVAELSSRVELLTATVTQQNETIMKLSTQLQFVLSFLDIQQTENNRLELSSSTWPTVAEAAQCPTNSTSGPTDQAEQGNILPVTSFADIVSRTVKSQNNQKREDLMAAIYIEQKNKAKRASSFMITGLQTDNVKGDTELVVELCRNEFNVDVDIASTKQVGQLRDAKPKLLMVNLRTESEAQHIISSARQLRSSLDSNVKANVYINANLTPAEAKASYELRQRRRQAARSNNDNRQGQLSVNAVPFQPTGASSIAVGVTASDELDSACQLDIAQQPSAGATEHFMTSTTQRAHSSSTESKAPAATRK